MFRLRTLRVAGDAVFLSQIVKVLSTGEKFVNIALMTGVENDAVYRRVEDSVHRNRDFNDTEIWSEVATDFSNRGD